MADLVDLRRLSPEHLEPLLLEETAEWRRELDWDFTGSADLVRKFAEAHGLSGFAVIQSSQVTGYGYTVLEENKGLIGDVFIRPAWRSADVEIRLFRALFDSLAGTPGVSRIESQLMLLQPELSRTLQRERFVRAFDRLLMTIDATTALPPAPARAAQRYYLEAWAEHHQESAANVISLAYNDHIDSRINDQYRTLQGARRFLHNIVQFPGCGSFHPESSFAAFERATGSIAGIVLTTFVSAGVAHIAQLCVTPRAHHTGLGYQLLREAVLKLQAYDALRISLTVTAANTDALHLYQRCGFRLVRHFPAYVWESY